MNNGTERHWNVRSARDNSHWRIEQVSSIFHASVQGSHAESHTTATQPGLLEDRCSAWFTFYATLRTGLDQGPSTFISSRLGSSSLVLWVLHTSMAKSQRLTISIVLHSWMISVSSMDTEPWLLMGLQRVVRWNKLTISNMLTFYLSRQKGHVLLSHIITWDVERTRIMGDAISWHRLCNAM